MIEHELLVARVVHGLAVVDRRELSVCAQRAGDAPRQRGARGRIAAVDRDEDQPRHDAVAQLIDEHALPGARCARQERGQVGREIRAGDRDPACDEREQPHEHGALPPGGQAPGDGSGRLGAFVHQFAGTGCRRIVEWSPSACRIATLRSTSRVPSSVIVLTTFSIRESSGVSVSVQSSPRPASATL
ncbi:hypothetical protein BamIOP4010DRAFT_5945 [Burkholderia ambifaria IOP40-10]|uniref:Uncharacterized protein n=1 Tax=Burkholderia ambifaria IOP40-10 TaxID=396596 RepID=B1FPI4_9BURK|nr:hypothetical protein BamIOP4010DRAFT_5945 [Burkholderia ambifaria IOP40-10]